MASATHVFPAPGSPESMANVPDASLSCQSHSTGRGWTSERQTMSAYRLVAVGADGTDGVSGTGGAGCRSSSGLRISASPEGEMERGRSWIGSAGGGVPGCGVKGRPVKIDPGRGLLNVIK